jgi:AcrR family transcriptional regulator
VSVESSNKASPIPEKGVGNIAILKTQRKRRTTPDKPITELAAQRREELAVAAGQLLQEHGFANTSVRMIAKKLGWSMGTLYLYAKNKEEVLDIVLRRWLHQYEEQWDEAEQNISDIRESLRGHVKQLVQLTNDYSGYTKVMYREAKSLSRSSLQRQMRGESRVAQKLIDNIRAGQRQGVFKPIDPTLVSFCIISLVQIMVFKRWAISDVTTESVADAVAEIVVDGITIQPGVDGSEAAGSPSRTNSSKGR